MVLGNTRRGGTQAFIMNLLRDIDKTKFQIDFAVNLDSEGGWGNEMRALGSNLFIVPRFNVINWMSYEKFWDKFLSEYPYDIVHGHTTNSAGIYLKVAKKHGCKTIAHIHSTGYRGGFLERLTKKVFSKLTKSQADYWFACSDKAAQFLYGNDFYKYPQYYEVPNSIKVENYLYNEKKRCEIRKELGLDEDTFLIGHVGTFSEPKNHTHILRVFKEVLKKQDNAKLLLIGEGYLKNEIFHQAEELGVRNYIINLKNIPNVYDYMMAMDVFIFPSIFEGFGMVVLEAQASGLKVVMSNVVPTVTHLTNLVTPLALDEPISVWAEECLNSKVANRQNFNKSIKQTKYDLEKNVKYISNLYTRLSEINLVWKIKRK